MDPNTEQKVAQKIGKYEIVAELGQGGMGTVYKARDPFIGRMVALKTINAELVSDQEILKRFYREAQSAGTLQHPNIVTIYDLGEADGRPYIAMEYVEGESLQNIVNRRARIPLAAKLKLVQQFCEGLGHAHKHGFVHRDVKPANILVTNEGVVKVVDFGIVHLETTNLTKTGMFLGTIHYASPEQINDGRVDSRSDLWSVACVVYEFIAYKKAFDGSNIAAIIAKVLSSEPEPLSRCCPGVPTELDAVISKGLKKNIDERYQSLDEMLGDLLPIARSMQQSFIGDLLQEAKDLRDKGDFNGAQEKIRAILILDNTHGEAKRLHSEIAAELHRLTPVIKAKKLVAEAELAFSRGDYAEAVRILGEAQELNPADTQARNLTEKARREQDRVRELREALVSGQRAMKQGDLTSAEQELHRVLQLDQNNPQAAELLEQIRQDRLSRERDFRLKEALWQADNLVSLGNYEEAQNRLLELQQDFPSSDEILQKLQELDPFIRSRKLVQDGERAFTQGEYAEAVRALTEALELNPQDKVASDLKERALQERDRLRQVREALSSGQRSMRQGDVAAAENELQRALQLDPTNTQATSLLGQIRNAQAAREREGRFREALQQSDNLVAAGKFDDAQRALQELQQEFPDSTEIDQKLLDLDQHMKLGRLILGGQTAFDQGEFGEAVRILTEAQELDPKNERVRELKVRAVQERDRLRQVREAISAGQRAMRQGDATAAEREINRALQLDAANAQATNLLAQIQKDRQSREREKRLKEGLNQAEKLLSAKRFDEAQRKLNELQQAYPDAEEIQQKLHALSLRRGEAATPVPPPAPSAPPERAPVRGAPVDDAAKSMQLAEELRRSLQGPRPSELAPPAMPPPPEIIPTIPVAQAPLQATQLTQVPAAEPVAEAHGATKMLRSSLKAQAEAEQKAMEAPPPPPLPPLPASQVQAPPPAPALPRVEPKKPAPAPPAIHVTPPPAPATKKMSPMIMVAVVVVLLIMGAGGYMIFHNRQQAVPVTNTPTAVVNTQQQEKDLLDQAKTAEAAQKWDDAIADYTKVAALNGPMKDAALEAINVVNQRKQGTDPATIEKGAYDQASAALKKKDYEKAESSFKQVITLNVPDSTLLPQAKEALEKIEPILQDKKEFDAAAGTQTRGDLQGALQQFQTIAGKPGNYQEQAKARIPKLNDMIQNKGAQAEYNAALQLEKTDPKGAREQFNAIAGKSGPFKTDALAQIKQIDEQFANQDAQNQFEAAAKLQSSGDLNGALTQFKALATKSGPKQVEALQRVQQINEQIQKQKDAEAQQREQQLLAAADQAQKSGDLKGALAQYKTIAGKPGPNQALAQAKVDLITQLLKPQAPTTPAPAPPTTPTTPTQTTQTTKPARNPVVTPLSSGDPRPLTISWHKGMTVADVNVDGGLKPKNLAMAPVQGAPAGSLVMIIIKVDETGSVTPDRVINDTSGFGPNVQEAARAWKFEPPTAKGKPVNTTLTVKVTF